MNVLDIDPNVIPDDFSKMDRLGWIFARQHELARKYIPIETANGLCLTNSIPVNIDDRYGQARLKDFFWRITEELTEAVDATVEHGHIPIHTIEELADALHFLVEAYILSGFSATDWGPFCEGQCRLQKILINARVPKSLIHGAYGVIHYVGCASNCLKQRPWKQTHQLTDQEKFRKYLGFAFSHLMSCFLLAGCNHEDIFAIYWKKSEVNRFRQRSNY